MMKFSVIICISNGEETLFRCLDAVKAIDYPKSDFEVIVVNNASTDRTFRIISGYDIRVIGCRKQISSSKVMELGTQKALYPNLLFIGQRTVVKKDILKKIKEIAYSPLISGELNIDKYRSGHDTFTYLINSKMYNPHFPQSKFGKELWISKKNFGKTYKNNAVFFIEKKLLVKIIGMGFDLNNGNNDLYRKIVYESKIKILSHTGIDVEHIADYRARTNRQIVENGYRWAKRNLSKFNLFSFTYYLIHAVILMIIIMYPNISIAVFLGSYILFLIYLSETKKDFWILFKTAPGEILRFYSGTIKYLTSRS